jgi:hypothetical protein
MCSSTVAIVAPQKQKHVADLLAPIGWPVSPPQIPDPPATFRSHNEAVTCPLIG